MRKLFGREVSQMRGNVYWDVTKWLWDHSTQIGGIVTICGGSVIAFVNSVPARDWIGCSAIGIGIVVVLVGWLGKRRTKPDTAAPAAELSENPASAKIDYSDPYWLRKELKRIHTEGYEIWVAMNLQISCDTVGFPNQGGRDEGCIQIGKLWLQEMRAFMDENLPKEQRDKFTASRYSSEDFKTAIGSKMPSNPTLLAVRGEMGFELPKIEQLINQF